MSASLPSGMRHSRSHRIGSRPWSRTAWNSPSSAPSTPASLIVVMPRAANRVQDHREVVAALPGGGLPGEVERPRDQRVGVNLPGLRGTARQ